MIWSGRSCTLTTAWLTPASASLSSAWSSSARPATCTSGFGIRSVKGRMRTPRPAARTMALAGFTGISKTSRPMVPARGHFQRIFHNIPIPRSGYAKTRKCQADHITVIRHAHGRFIAIAARHDGYTTATCSDFGVLRRAAPRRLLLFALLQEADPDLVAIDPGEFAAPVGKAGG